jgi:hypothetical protein
MSMVGETGGKVDYPQGHGAKHQPLYLCGPVVVPKKLTVMTLHGAHEDARTGIVHNHNTTQERPGKRYSL